MGHESDLPRGCQKNPGGKKFTGWNLLRDRFAGHLHRGTARSREGILDFQKKMAKDGEINLVMSPGTNHQDKLPITPE